MAVEDIAFSHMSTLEASSNTLSVMLAYARSGTRFHDNDGTGLDDETVNSTKIHITK